MDTPQQYDYIVDSQWMGEQGQRFRSINDHEFGIYSGLQDLVDDADLSSGARVFVAAGVYRSRSRRGLIRFILDFIRRKS